MIHHKRTKKKNEKERFTHTHTKRDRDNQTNNFSNGSVIMGVLQTQQAGATHLPIRFPKKDC